MTPYQSSYTPAELLPRADDPIEVQIKDAGDKWFSAVREASNYWLIFDGNYPALFDSYIVRWRPKR